jgi:colanic acid/amylovoran biosynthesis protein
VVLLPQALGPFDQSDVRDAFQEVVDHCDLLFARDPVSFEYVQQLTTHDKLRLAPDFTNLVQCTSSGWQSDDTYDSLIIPNHRMLEKTDPTTRDQYIPFLARCFQELEALDMRPAVLLHDNRIDHQLVDPLKQQLNRDITVISNTNPLVLKSMIGAARLIVGSRFHGLVSALSQGIPAFAAGWSHKYEMLFRDYGCEDRVLSVDLKSTQIRDLFRPVAESWQDSHRSLCEHAHTQRQLAADMWKQVFDVLAQ